MGIYVLLYVYPNIFLYKQAAFDKLYLERLVQLFSMP